MLDRLPKRWAGRGYNLWRSCGQARENLRQTGGTNTQVCITLRSPVFKSACFTRLFHRLYTIFTRTFHGFSPLLIPDFYPLSTPPTIVTANYLKLKNN